MKNFMGMIRDRNGEKIQVRGGSLVDIWSEEMNGLMNKS